MRLGARLKEDQNCGSPLTSVAGGLRKDGMLLASAGSLRPGVGERALIGDVYRAFGREGGIAERGCMRSGRGDNHSGCADTEKAATGKLIHWPNLHRLSMPHSRFRAIIRRALALRGRRPLASAFAGRSGT